MFELYQRDGHSKHKVAEAEELEDLARISAEMSGVDLYRRIADGGERDE